MMTKNKKDIFEEYMLPERPFMYGMASAFDLFGVLGQGKLERIQKRYKAEALQAETTTLSDVWQEVGDTLLEAIDRYEKDVGESSAA